MATNLAGFSVPVEVGGDRLAHMATAREEEVPSGSYVSSAPEATSETVTRALAEGFDIAPISEEAKDGAAATKLWEK